MSWKCEIVTDLAPLYHDKEASKASRKLVKEHLRECPECRAYYKKYRPVETMAAEEPVSDGVENFVLLAKKMRRRRQLLLLGFLFYFAGTMWALVLHHQYKTEKFLTKNKIFKIL